MSQSNDRESSFSVFWIPPAYIMLGQACKPEMTNEGELNIMLSKKQDTDRVASNEVEQTVVCFKKGLNCAQAMLSTYGPQFGLGREDAIRIARAFGSGMGMGETCGAVTGALMVIGLKHAKLKDSFFSKDKTEDIAREFVERFKARNKTTECKELLGCDVSLFEGLKTAKKEKHFKRRCPTFVRDAAEIVEEILKDRP
jgi:C_GCAxxG_C_C family probable redox protein